MRNALKKLKNAEIQNSEILQNLQNQRLKFFQTENQKKQSQQKIEQLKNKIQDLESLLVLQQKTQNQLGTQKSNLALNLQIIAQKHEAVVEQKNREIEQLRDELTNSKFQFQILQQKIVKIFKKCQRVNLLLAN